LEQPAYTMVSRTTNRDEGLCDLKMKPNAILLTALVTLTLCVPTGDALAKCKLGKLAEIPVIMNGMRPTITAKINGSDAAFLVDSGAFYSSLTLASAAQFKLPLSPAPHEFLVGGSEPGSGVAGLLGQNILRPGSPDFTDHRALVQLASRAIYCGCGADRCLSGWPDTVGRPLCLPRGCGCRRRGH
jgi:hypothetical protein